MNRAIRIAVFVFAITGLAAIAQTPSVTQQSSGANSPNIANVAGNVTGTLTPKDTAASQVLAQLAKDHAADQTALNTKFQQARASLDQSNKSLNDQIASLQKALQDDLNKDKKYKPRLDQITDLQKKLGENGSNANLAWQKDVAPLQQKVLTEQAQIDGLVPVIRKENGFPDNAAFDAATGKWTVPEPKK